MEILQSLIVTLLDLLIWIPHKRSDSFLLGFVMLMFSKIKPSTSEIRNVVSSNTAFTPWIMTFLLIFNFPLLEKLPTNIIVSSSLTLLLNEPVSEK